MKKAGCLDKSQRFCFFISTGRAYFSELIIITIWRLHARAGFRKEVGKMKSDRFIFRLFFLLAGLVLMLPMSSSGAAYPVAVTDASQHKLFFPQKPQRVVCLVPYITEMLTAGIRSGTEVLVGLIQQDLTLNSGLGLRKKNEGDGSQSGGDKGFLLGTAYQLKDGRVIYVPNELNEELMDGLKSTTRL